MWDVIRAYVVGHVQSPCYGTSSGPMLWELFETHDVRRVRDQCCGTCSRPISQDMSWDYVVRRVRAPYYKPCSGCVPGLYREMCQGLMLWYVFEAHGVNLIRAYDMGRGRAPCSGTCSGPMLWERFKTHDMKRIRERCCGTSSRPISQDVFCACIVRHGRAPY